MFLIKDDYSRFCFAYMLKEKLDTAGRIKAVIHFAEKVSGHPVKLFRSDNGKEFVNRDVLSVLKGNGVHHQQTVSCTPEQNGAAERENRTVMEAARAMLHAKQIN